MATIITENGAKKVPGDKINKGVLAYFLRDEEYVHSVTETGLIVDTDVGQVSFEVIPEDHLVVIEASQAFQNVPEMEELLVFLNQLNSAWGVTSFHLEDDRLDPSSAWPASPAGAPRLVARSCVFFDRYLSGHDFLAHFELFQADVAWAQEGGSLSGYWESTEKTITTIAHQKEEEFAEEPALVCLPSSCSNLETV